MSIISPSLYCVMLSVNWKLSALCPSSRSFSVPSCLEKLLNDG